MRGRTLHFGTGKVGDRRTRPVEAGTIGGAVGRTREIGWLADDVALTCLPPTPGPTVFWSQPKGGWENEIVVADVALTSHDVFTDA